MTTEAIETNTPAEAATVTQQVVTPPVSKPNASQTGEEPDWLPKRLEQASRSAANAVLSSLGFDSEESAKKALAELKTFRESQMTEQERIQARLAELEPAASKVSSLENTVKSWAERAVSDLTESQRDAVQKLAGGDPSKVLSAIDILRPTWAAVQAAPVKTEPTTTTASAGPPDGGTSSSADIKSEFANSKNPFRRAAIASAHSHQLITR